MGQNNIYGDEPQTPAPPAITPQVSEPVAVMQSQSALTPIEEPPRSLLTRIWGWISGN